MISSTLAVLKSPTNGVSGAVTGYPIGRGNGVSTVFAAPPEITAITTLYRRDWQGNMALSANPRTNLCSYSENQNGANWGKTNVSLTSGIDDPKGGTSAFTARATAGNGSIRWNTPPTVTPGLSYVSSMWIRRRTGSGIVKMLNTTYSAWNPVIVSANWTRLNTSDVATGTICYGGFMLETSGDEIDIAFAQTEVGISPTSYIPTVATPVTITDYVASGTTLTLAEAPTLAAELTVDGTGVNLPLLQIGG